MKFQNPSMHGSEVMLCIKKCNRRTDGRTNVPKAICPSNFFEVGGIMNKVLTVITLCANSADDKLITFFLFCPENRI